MNYYDSSWSNNQNSQGFFNQFIQAPPFEFRQQPSNDGFTIMETDLDQFFDAIDERFVVMESKFESKFDKFMKAISSKINI